MASLSNRLGGDSSVSAPVPIPADSRPTTPASVLPDSGSQSVLLKVLAYFGLGRNATRARKSLVSFVWNISWGLVQSVTIIVLLFLVKFTLKSPRNSEIPEWDACDRPLGVWAALWLIRVVLASSLSYWEFRRARQLHFQGDLESGDSGTPSAPTAASGNEQPQPQSTAVEPSSLPYTQLYSRLTLFSSLVTLVWFVTANVLVYSSLNTCRFDAPRLWWLNFAILCVLYLMVLEVVALGFVVLIVAPILFIFWNIFLICIGRHPMQNPNAIKPEIGKLPRSAVEKIPLVNYIPPPPSVIGFVQEPSFPQMYYPPQPKKQQMRFRLLENFSILGSRYAKKENGQTENEGENSDSWADTWEQGQYPFITLEGNRATCAICLSDFEAPPKRKTPAETPAPQVQEVEPVSDQTDITQEPNTEGQSQGEPLKLQDAGSGPQPLRLLGCAHAFHKSCIDPWLTDVSGRCPVCQRAVEPRKPHKSQRL